MRCDDWCPRCGKPEETLSHAIFKCHPALQAWALSTTPSFRGNFPSSSIYANIDYLFWRKDQQFEPILDTDPYPWIIWYLWKARNDKLFREIDRDPHELVRFAESKCQAWYDANEKIPSPTQELDNEENQAVSLGGICMIYGSLIADGRFSGSGWVLTNSSGREQLMGTRNILRRQSALYAEVVALRWALEGMLQHSTCQRFRTDCKDLIKRIGDPVGWPAFATELEELKSLLIYFPRFSITFLPRANNKSSDSLAKAARSFRRELCYIGFSILFWIPRPLLV